MAEIAERLVRLPPDEFVAARNAAAKELRAGGDKELAKAVAAMRKPSWVDYALNGAAVDDVSAVADFAAAAAAMRDAQTGAVEAGGGGASLGEAQRAFRAAQRPVVAAANATLRRAGRQTDTAGLAARLIAVAGSAELSDRLRGGVLGIDEGSPLAADLAPVPLVARAASAPAKKASAGKGKAAKEKTAPTAARRRQLQTELDRATRRHVTAEAAAEAAATALTAADEEVERATAALARAEQDASAARAVVRETTSELKAATKAMTTAERASTAAG